MSLANYTALEVSKMEVSTGWFVLFSTNGWSVFP